MQPNMPIQKARVHSFIPHVGHVYYIWQGQSWWCTKHAAPLQSSPCRLSKSCPWSSWTEEETVHSLVWPQSSPYSPLMLLLQFSHNTMSKFQTSVLLALSSLYLNLLLFCIVPGSCFRSLSLGAWGGWPHTRSSSFFSCGGPSPKASQRVVARGCWRRIPLPPSSCWGFTSLFPLSGSSQSWVRFWGHLTDCCNVAVSCSTIAEAAPLLLLLHRTLGCSHFDRPLIPRPLL